MSSTQQMYVINTVVVAFALAAFLIVLTLSVVSNSREGGKNSTITRGRQLQVCSTLTEQAAKALCVQKVVSY